MTTLAVIPARGGSKRIPFKNIKDFCGKPMIAYSILAAKQAGCFDHIVVSTDSQDIADVATQFGASVPFMRPPTIADDHTPLAPVIQHAVKALQDEGHSITHACCILATAPLMQSRDLVEGFRKITSSGSSSVFSVASFPYPIQRALKISKQGTLSMFYPEHELTRSNDLEEAYHDAGQFYWLATSSFMQTGKIFTQDALPVILPRHLVQDIDTPEDWTAAEFLFKAIHKQ